MVGDLQFAAADDDLAAVLGDLDLETGHAFLLGVIETARHRIPRHAHCGYLRT